MKRRIAVCGSAWSNEYLKTVMTGIRRCAEENGVDVFLLVNYVVSEKNDFKTKGEVNIFRLLEYGSFDGVILLGNTLHLQEEYTFLCKTILDQNLPAISLEYQLSSANIDYQQNIEFIGTDNYSGMYELCEHLVQCHGVKETVFISGPSDNEESNTRRQALEDVLRKNGCSLKETNVICCNWNYFEVVDELPKWLSTHTALPDAFVCANDVMAMATCSILEDHNIHVPEDVLVTGFDHLDSGISYTPMISSVDRNWNDMGYLGMQRLLDKLDNKQTVCVHQINSRAVPATSCGCEPEIRYRRTTAKNQDSYDNFVNNALWGGHLCDIAEVLSRVVGEKEMHDAFTELQRYDPKYEGDEVYVCLVNTFFSSITDEEKKLPVSGYTDQMDAICFIRDGIAHDRVLFDTGMLIPGYDRNAEGGKFYVFTPLYNREGCYGYVAFGEEPPMLYDYSLYNWMRNLKQSFEYIRQNIMMVELNCKLAELSLTDGLTGVYNRMGCEKIAYQYLTECRKQGKRAVMMFADIDKMKQINDKYGHLQGDVAITTVAQVIKEVLHDDWIVVRYGGDEFLMVGECTEDELPKRLMLNIRKQLAKTAEEKQLPYSLSVGLGFVIVEPNEEMELVEYLRRADEAMYEMKNEGI